MHFFEILFSLVVLALLKVHRSNSMLKWTYACEVMRCCNVSLTNVFFFFCLHCICCILPPKCAAALCITLLAVENDAALLLAAAVAVAFQCKKKKLWNEKLLGHCKWMKRTRINANVFNYRKTIRNKTKQHRKKLKNATLCRQLVTQSVRH